MSYRPQYAYPPTPAGFEDETFDYSFDQTNTPVLALPILAGGQANDIMLPLQADAPFIARGILILNTAGGGSPLNMRLKTPHGDYIATSPVPSARWANGSIRATSTGKVKIPLEPEIECPAGSVWTFYLQNPTLGSLAPPTITLYGIKRRVCNPKGRAA
jgi:hypothetical protein